MVRFYPYIWYRNRWIHQRRTQWSSNIWAREFSAGEFKAPDDHRSPCITPHNPYTLSLQMNMHLTLKRLLWPERDLFKRHLL